MTHYTTLATAPGRPVTPAPRPIAPAPAPLQFPGSRTRWTVEDAARAPDRYLRWLERIPAERWIAIHASPGRHAEDFDQALTICRAYKARHQEYTAAGSPPTMRPELQRLERQMRETLKRLDFPNPAALWAEYQARIAARDEHGRHPAHTAQIASLDHYLWLKAITAIPAMDWHQRGDDADYPCIYNNVDAALENDRYTAHQRGYAAKEDSEAAYLRQQVAHRMAHLARLDARLERLRRITRRSSDPAQRSTLIATGKRLRRLRDRVAARLEQAQLALDELDASDTPGSMAYGLTRTAPIPTNGRWQIMDLDDRLADTLDSIRNLLRLHARNQDHLFELETTPAPKRTIGQIRELAERYETQDAITRSLDLLERRAHPEPPTAPRPTPDTPELISDEEWLELQERLARFAALCKRVRDLRGKRDVQRTNVAAPAPPTVVHCQGRRTDGPGFVYVGRPSKWGNPFQIGRDGDRATVIQKYRRWLAGQPELLAALPELTGKQLGCWCAPDACHAEVLVRAWWHYVGQCQTPLAA